MKHDSRLGSRRTSGRSQPARDAGSGDCRYRSHRDFPGGSPPIARHVVLLVTQWCLGVRGGVTSRLRSQHCYSGRDSTAHPPRCPRPTALPPRGRSSGAATTVDAVALDETRQSEPRKGSLPLCARSKRQGHRAPDHRVGAWLAQRQLPHPSPQRYDHQPRTDPRVVGIPDRRP
jgi:hypothetical protein